MFCCLKLAMPSFKVDGNELVNIDIPDQFPGKVYREYNNTIQPGDGSNSENQKKMPSVTCRSVTHSQQRFNWDCGLACILMALDAADELEAKDRISSDLEKVCQNEGFGHSTWTIDLAYLLKNFAPQLKFSYTTITIGVDQSYMNQEFYNKILNRDSQRVQDRFDTAQTNGIEITEKSVTIQDIVQHISDSGTCIVLTNANLLSCQDCNYFSLSGCENSTRTNCFLLRHCGGNAYQGHYVLAVGFDIPKKKLYYRNPSLRDRVCVMSFDHFDEARNSYGTDEDVIFVNAVNDD